ncbi:MAG TPA: hypothetical protein VGM03_12500, partial [Phycisphaerae bacterium]
MMSSSGSRIWGFTGAALLALLMPRGVWAVDVIVQNDSVMDNTQVAIQAGFAQGEIGAAIFSPPASLVQFPVKLKAIQIFWLSLSGTTGQTLGGAIHIYSSGLPNPQEVCIVPDDCALLGPVLEDGFLNEFVVDPADPNVVEGVTSPIILNGPKFAIGYEFDADPDPSNGPSLVTDTNGCQGSPSNFFDSNTKNAVRLTSGTWVNLCAFGVSGDLFIRARVEHVITDPPTVTSITPNTANNGGPVNISDLHGTNFISGTTVKLTQTGQPDINGTNVVVVSESQITCTFNLTGAATGLWNVVATNTNGSGQLTSGFNVSAAPPPTLSAFSPNTPQANCGVISCGVFGNNLQSGALLRAVHTGAPDILAANYNYQNQNFIGFTLNIGGADQGAWSIVLTNPNNAQATLNNVLNITACQPTITSISPNSGANNGPINITDLHGSNFVDGPTADSTVQLTRVGQSPISGTNLSIVSSSQISCTFDITAALPGMWNVVVNDPNGGTATLINGFNVIAGPPPTVFFIDPNSATNCGPLTGATIFGFNFFTVGTTQAKLTRTGQSDINGTNVVVQNSNTITADFNLTGAAAGMWNVVVINPDLQQGMLADALTVNACTTGVTIITANPPAASPYGPGVFRDVLQNTTAGLMPQGIGVAGTPDEGAVSYAAISVSFSGTPSPAPAPANITSACTDIAGNGQG